MDATLIAVAATWGALTGMLLPRAAYRLSVEPDEPWRDACPSGHPISGVAGGWFGSARCASCVVAVTPVKPAATPGVATTSVPYRPSVAVPLVTAVACAALAAATGARPELVVWVLLAPVAVLLTLVDRRVHRLPDQLTLPLAAAAAVLLGLAGLLPAAGGSWTSALLGGLALGSGYLTLFLIHPAGMGFGDVKLALSLGTMLGWYGWPVLLAGAFTGFLLGSLYGLGLIALRLAGRRTAIPFGPFMIAGTLAGLLLGAS
ncbi:prepilin peptidase [Streptomyces sp. NPDC002187]|uniref:prepilin peptidase n=1 Tax=Streptomyces sp. NPDC002187 TaxID=3364637 RepID=UPI0036B0A76D